MDDSADNVGKMKSETNDLAEDATPADEIESPMNSYESYEEKEKTEDKYEHNGNTHSKIMQDDELKPKEEKSEDIDVKNDDSSNCNNGMRD